MVKNGNCETEKYANKKSGIWKEIMKNKYIYIMLIPGIVLMFIFSYMPMVGLKMAFQTYNIYEPAKSIFNGLDNFKAIFELPDALSSIGNTMIISLLSLVVCFPITIIFALMLNETKNIYFKKVIQTVSYLPHFLSWISVIGIVATLYSPSGIINDALELIFGSGYERTNLLALQWFFIPDVIILTTWKTLGWNSIIFLAAVTGIDQNLYEAAMLDGAGKFKQIIHITLPGILPTIMIMLLWRIAALFGDNFELIYGLQNPFVNVEVIGTIIYKNGIAGGNYGIATALGLMQGLVNFLFLVGANWISKKGTDVGIF